jgi:class 3 adenylate cyclase
VIGKDSNTRKTPAPGTTSTIVSRPRAKQTDTSQDTVLSGIRHNLRTPLNQIIGYSEMLQEEAGDLGLEAYVPDLQKIHTAGTQLLTLINDNISHTRIESGKFELDSLQRDSRTLLDLIIGYNELCQEDAAEQNHVSFIADLKKIHKAAKTLLELLSDIEFLKPLRKGARKTNLPGDPDAPGGGVTSVRSVTGAAAAQALVGFILVVDDNEMNRDMLCRRLERQGHTVLEAENGRKALEILESVRVDLVLLDILMPELDGLQTLEMLKADPAHRYTPVIMLSALDELDSVVRCIEMGAEDYLPKPFKPVLLNARIGACLEKKRLQDQEHAFLAQLRLEREKSERLLLNVLPKSIADRLKQGEKTIADSFADATVLFADLVGFTKLSSHVPAPELVRMLDEIFSKFDWLAELHHLEKIKTIGDAYMVAGGLPVPRPDHAEAMAEMALDMQKVITRLDHGEGRKFDLRIGISSGPVVAGIIGSKKFIYDLWGDTVNIAFRMESLGQIGAIQVSEATYEHLKDKYVFEKRGKIEVKGKGKMTTFLLTGRKPVATSA